MPLVFPETLETNVVIWLAIALSALARAVASVCIAAVFVAILVSSVATHALPE